MKRSLTYKEIAIVSLAHNLDEILLYVISYGASKYNYS